MDLQGQDGLLDTYRSRIRTRGVLAVAVAAAMIAFYIALYQTELFTPFAAALGLPSKWFLYGGLYGIVMTAGAAYYLKHHGNSRYNRIRIAVNLGIQWLIAFIVPYVLLALTGKDYYFSYFWPLKIEYFYPGNILRYPVAIIVYSFVGSIVAVPILTVLYGKRWYCSWVCGCGALANTFGDPWRHLTSTSTKAWRFEQFSVHTMLGVALIGTALVILAHFFGRSSPSLASIASDVQTYYGFAVGFILAGAAGTGLYPLFGPRVWCRNFCPMAAMLGLIQKLGRFRITVKKDMCISCGNCSAYCEMGIDVRAYAQKNESFTRAACVGCGMCAHVCPRGVLRLENRATDASKRKRKLTVMKS